MAALICSIQKQPHNSQLKMHRFSEAVHFLIMQVPVYTGTG